MFSSIEPSGSSVIILIGGRGLGGGGGLMAFTMWTLNFNLTVIVPLSISSSGVYETK